MVHIIRNCTPPTVPKTQLEAVVDKVKEEHSKFEGIQHEAIAKHEKKKREAAAAAINGFIWMNMYAIIVHVVLRIVGL